MAETRKIIRMFLASPGDLGDERKSIRSVVEELNTIMANRIGYHVELMGWEDTVSRYGRPQAIINQEVDRCDLFVGMMWKKWGTPPDTSGIYTSGFHEEFERSIARRENKGEPEISLFFREIDAQFLEDKGPDLERVLEFKDKIIQEKTVLFQCFNSLHEIESLVRGCISGFLFRIHDAESSEAEESTDKQTKTQKATGQSDSRSHQESPLSSEGCKFLDDFSARIRNAKKVDEISAYEVARFRLLATLVSRKENDSPQLGVHDLNILFASKETCDFGPTERVRLAAAGFENVHHENAPLWHWYTRATKPRYYCALASSIIGRDDNEKVGAIRVLDALGVELPEEFWGTSRSEVLEDWLSGSSSIDVKHAAMDFIAYNGRVEDLGVLKAEYDLNSYDTARRSLEAMIRLLLRTGPAGAAEKLVLETQFNTLDSSLLNDALEGVYGLQTEELLNGLEHRNGKVRLRALRVLGGRGVITGEIAKELRQDGDAAIRFEALTIHESHGEAISTEEAKNILVKPQKGSSYLPSFGLFPSSLSSVIPDKKGEQFFKQFQYSRMSQLREKELLNCVRQTTVFDDIAYFVLVEKYFRKHATELRTNVDEKFERYFQKGIDRLRKLGSDSRTDELVRKTKDLEESIRQMLTRRGLDVLCRILRPEDTGRIRDNLKTGFAGTSSLDARYLEKYGQWADIDLLANANPPKPEGTILLSNDDTEYYSAAAKAIYRIGQKSISALFDLNLPSVPIESILSVCHASVFRNISDSALFKLLYNEVGGVRKAASMLAVRSFSKKRLVGTLNEYLSGADYRYYNVIHWLDLGVSMSRHESKKIVLSASRK